MVRAEKKADTPMPTRIRRMGLLLFPLAAMTMAVEMAAPIKAPAAVEAVPAKANQPQIIAATAPVDAPDETPNT